MSVGSRFFRQTRSRRMAPTQVGVLRGSRRVQPQYRGDHVLRAIVKPYKPATPPENREPHDRDYRLNTSKVLGARTSGHGGG